MELNIDRSVHPAADQNGTANTKLRPSIRIMLSVVSIPGLLLVVFQQVAMIYFNHSLELDLFSIIYGLASLMIVGVAIIGRLSRLKATDVKH